MSAGLGIGHDFKTEVAGSLRPPVSRSISVTLRTGDACSRPRAARFGHNLVQLP